MSKVYIDARHQRCPLPLLKLKQALGACDIGDIIEIRATDAGTWRDIPTYVQLTAHQLLEQVHEQDIYCYQIQKGE